MATIAYLAPPTVASATPPTLAQMSRRNMVAVDVSVAVYDTTITLTHNMGLTAAELTSGYPEVNLLATAVDYYTAVPRVTSKTANTIVVTVTDAVHTLGAHFRAFIRRPYARVK